MLEVSTMTFEDFIGFLESKMRMSHVYQPLLIKTLVAAGGTATLRQLAIAFLAEDESQLLFYEDRIEKMPVRVLKRHGVIKQDGDLISLAIPRMDFQQRSKVRELCERRLQAFLQQRGLDVWANRMLEFDPVPDVLRYQALAASGGRCALCGATKDESPLHVDHILPRSRHGKNVLANLQVLCAECNSSKGNKDVTDFRVAEATLDPDCLFCSPGFLKGAIAENRLSYAAASPEPAAPGHVLVIPRRHTDDFFTMTAAERADAEDLLRVLRNQLQTEASGALGFAVGMKCGAPAGQARAHAHIDLIPRG
jgi:diadenosine tetraphosphate (Ap4A) HIT family hydrolase/5-methylcytosine-specific restriction endonuclease McrA